MISIILLWLPLKCLKLCEVVLEIVTDEWARHSISVLLKIWKNTNSSLETGQSPGSFLSNISNGKISLFYWQHSQRNLQKESLLKSSSPFFLLISPPSPWGFSCSEGWSAFKDTVLFSLYWMKFICKKLLFFFFFCELT